MMDQRQLAETMLRWGDLQRQADVLAAEIKAAVLAIGKTQTVGNVSASFSAGRRTFDYRAAVDKAETSGNLAPGSLAPWESLKIDYFTAVEKAIGEGILSREYLMPYTETVIDWAGAAKGLNLQAPVASQTAPSVTVKFV